MAGFSDIPLVLPPEAKTHHDIFESKYVTKYLDDYVDDHVYQGRSIRDRIVFGFKIADAEKRSGVWTVSGTRNGNETVRLISSRLVVATGHTSIPSMPILPNQNIFQGPVLHQKDFGGASPTIFASSSYTNVTVLGGGKSAADMVYDSVKAGKNVSWIIREEGEGPAAFASAVGNGPYRNSTEIAAARMVSALSPSCFAPITWKTRLLHGSVYGRNLLAKMWLGADRSARELANFRSREGARPGFEKLESSMM